MKQPEVKVGQVWEDSDPRHRGARRRVKIEDLVPRHKPTDALVVNIKTGRKTQIDIKRLKPGSTGYKLMTP